MAAGLTVAADKVDALADFLDERLSGAVAKARDDRALLIDAVLALAGVNPDFVAAIDAGGPYSPGWPAPLIASGPMRVIKADVVGTGHLHAIHAGDDGRSAEEQSDGKEYVRECRYRWSTAHQIKTTTQANEKTT